MSAHASSTIDDEALHKELARYVSHEGSRRPHVVLMIGPCRSGTTAISRSVANAGMPVVYQKVKEALRTVRLLSKPEEMDENLRADLLSVQVLPEESLRIPAGPVVFWKETLGGYTALESSFDPVSMLLNAGWLPQEISLITILRDPIVCLESWMKCFGKSGKSTVMANFSTAMEATQRIGERATKAGVQHIPFVYEAFSSSADFAMTRRADVEHEIGNDHACRVLVQLLRECNVDMSELNMFDGATGWLRHTADKESDTVFQKRFSGSFSRFHAAIAASDGLNYVQPKSREEIVDILGAEVVKLAEKKFSEAYSKQAVECKHWLRQSYCE